MYWIYAIFERVTWLFTFVLTRFFGSFKVIGRENLTGLPRPLMVIANHHTFFDPLIIGTLFPFFSRYIPIAFMVDDKYYNNPFLKFFFRLTQTFPSYYSRGLDVSLRGPRQVLKNGGVFLIFPEGERHTAGPRPRPKRGAATLALERPHLTILPINLGYDSNKKATATIGRPFKLSNITTNSDLETVSRLLAEEIYKLEQVS
ncbi:MAG: lysophospholipid acyltransferase family protein [Patescibacteria group bacterium]